MKNRILDYIKKEQLPLPPSRLIVAVSGGADSVFLLRILVELGYNCVVAHCNFSLRGAESDRDETFVRTVTQKLSVPLRTIRFQTINYAKKNHLSVEMAARELRYNWFEKIRQEENAVAIAVAHHADDIIETFLINLTRKTGIKGLTGIKPKNGNIIRPLLNLYRSDIESFMKNHNFEFVTDSTNNKEIYLRNQFRLSVIPLLEKVNPNVKQNLLTDIQILSDVEKIYQTHLSSVIKNIITVTQTQTVIDVEKLKSTVATKTILFETLRPYGFSFSQIENLLSVSTQTSGNQYFSETHRLITSRNQWIISKIENTNNNSIWISEEEKNIDYPVNLKIEELSAENIKFSKEATTAYFDAEKIHFPLEIRKWKNGDSFYPFGMTQRKKISDFFIDSKMSLLEKENALLLLNNSEIAWVIGRRTDNRFRVTQNTKRILKISLL